MNKVDEKITEICKQYNNVCFLHKTTFQYQDICFIGATLWSKLSYDLNEGEYIYNMCDFQQISIKNPYSNKDNLMHPSDYMLLHKNCLDFIQNSLNSNTKCIVITHHAPSYQCIEEKFHGDKFNSCFASNLDYILGHEHLIGWIYGHLHNNCKELNEKILYSNCYRTHNYVNNDTILINTILNHSC
jgi:predicted phosphohydrolase